MEDRDELFRAKLDKKPYLVLIGHILLVEWVDMADKFEAFYDHIEWFVGDLRTSGNLVSTNLKTTTSVTLCEIIFYLSKKNNNLSNMSTMVMENS